MAAGLELLGCNQYNNLLTLEVNFEELIRAYKIDAVG